MIDGLKINVETENRSFSKPEAARPLQGIRADLLAVEKEAEGLPKQTIGETNR